MRRNFLKPMVAALILFAAAVVTPAPGRAEGSGQDVLLGGAGDDYLLGGAGLDVLIGNTGDRLLPESRCHRESGYDCELMFVEPPGPVPIQVGVYWDCTTDDATRLEVCDLKVVACDDDGFCVERKREPECRGYNGTPCDYTANVPEPDLEPLVINPEWKCGIRHGFEICHLVLKVCTDDGLCFEI